MSEKTKVEESVTTEAPEQGAPDLTVQDLQALKSIIDVSTQRGAFKANELAVVGATYNKLEAFLQAVSQTAKQGE
jgi:D-alanyl-D-alanine carboxypeptidase